jgi:TolB-like protein
MKTEDLVAQLSRNPNVRVRNRVPVYPPVRAANQSEVAKARRRVRVGVELVGPESAAGAWARSYEVTLRDGFNIEDEVATTILEAVRAALDSGFLGSGWRLKVELADGTEPA